MMATETTWIRKRVTCAHTGDVLADEVRAMGADEVRVQVHVARDARGLATYAADADRAVRAVLDGDGVRIAGDDSACELTRFCPDGDGGSDERAATLREVRDAIERLIEAAKRRHANEPPYGAYQRGTDSGERAGLRSAHRMVGDMLRHADD